MTLVVAIGGVRSGKSAWAEHQADELAGGAGVTVLATADAADASMADRIARHAARRPGSWSVVEMHGREELAAALPGSGVALLDGLGGWVAGLLGRAGAFGEDRAAARAASMRASAQAHAAIQALIDAASEANRALVVATEETGLGVVPMGAGTAAWVDLVGELNQRLVRAADLAVVVVAGRALPLTDAVVPLTRADSSPSLTVMRSHRDALAVAAPDDAERRAHPRLLGAGVAARRAAAAAATATAAAPPTIGEPVDLAALRQHGDRLVRPGDADHAVNVVAEGPPAWLTDAFAAALANDLTRYPAAAAAEGALGELYARPAEEVVATNGAAQAFWLLPAALRPRLAAVVHPVFTEAEAALHAHGVPAVRIHRDPSADFALDPFDVPDDADLVIVSNPAAASGTLAARDEILALRRPGRTVVVDEAFMDLVPGEAESLSADRSDDLIVIRSFTKSLSIPGVRCGAALTSPATAARIRAVLPPWSVNAFALAGLVALADHAEELAVRGRRATAEREDLVNALHAIAAIQVWPSATNHVLVKVTDGPRVVEALRARRIAVRPCGSFPGLTDNHLRITARDRSANALLVATLAEVLAR